MLDGLSCGICGSTFARKDSLRKHLEIIHSGLKPFKCFHCDYKAGKKGQVKSHCVRRHEMTEQEFDERAAIEYKELKKQMGRPRKGESIYAAPKDENYM